MKRMARVNSTVRTPEQMAKAALKLLATDQLTSNHLAQEATVTVRYMGIDHVLTALPTVNVKTGQLMFYCGAQGRNRLGFEPSAVRGTDWEKLSFGVGVNIQTGIVVDGIEAVQAQYGITPGGDADEDLEAGETTA